MFQLYRVPRDGQSMEAELITLRLIVGPGDSGEPVITILLQHEDRGIVLVLFFQLIKSLT